LPSRPSRAPPAVVVLILKILYDGSEAAGGLVAVCSRAERLNSKRKEADSPVGRLSTM
jgi:hypothetical protein